MAEFGADEPKKDSKVRIEAPQVSVPEVVPNAGAPFPKLYYVLLVLVFVFSGLSLYLSFGR